MSTKFNYNNITLSSFSPLPPKNTNQESSKDITLETINSQSETSKQIKAPQILRSSAEPNPSEPKECMSGTIISLDTEPQKTVYDPQERVKNVVTLQDALRTSKFIEEVDDLKAAYKHINNAVPATVRVEKVKLVQKGEWEPERIFEISVPGRSRYQTCELCHLTIWEKCFESGCEV